MRRTPSCWRGVHPHLAQDRSSSRTPHGPPRTLTGPCLWVPAPFTPSASELCSPSAPFTLSASEPCSSLSDDRQTTALPLDLVSLGAPRNSKPLTASGGQEDAVAFLMGHQSARRPRTRAPKTPPQTQKQGAQRPPALPGAHSLTDIRHHHCVVHCHMHSQGAPGVEDSQLPTGEGRTPR